MQYPVTIVLAAATAGLLTASGSTEAFGQSATDLIATCSDRASDLEARQNAGAALTHMDPIKLSPIEADAAITCLREVFGADFVYNGFAIYSPELDAVAAAERRQQQEMKAATEEARREDLSAAIKDTCLSELNADRFRALTTPSCQDVFLEFGLPD